MPHAERLEDRTLLTVLFTDSFEQGEWNGLWVEDGQNDWFDSTQRATDGSFSAEVDGNANDATLTMATPIDLSGMTSPELTFDWLIENGFDSGEYLTLDVSSNGGSTWQTDVRRLDGNVDPENTWHAETVDLSPYASSNLLIRFRSKVNRANEDANVDNVQITAEDGVPQLAIDDIQQFEGDTGTTAFIFTVTRSGDTSGTSSVDWAAADGTAQAGSDYVAANGTVQFLAGEVTQTITVDVNGDLSDESDETFVVNLTNAVDATITDGQGDATILDDDGEVFPNDPEFADEWALHNTGQTEGTYDADIDMPAAWSVTTGNMSTVVAILGVGVDYTSPDLYLNMWLNESEIPAGIAALLTDSDGDGIVTFRDLNDPSNSALVSDINGNGFIDGGDLLADPSWEDGIDTDGNGFIDDLIGWDFIDNDNDPLPAAGSGHETGIAKYVGAITNNGLERAGINWEVRMMPVRTGLQPIVENFDAAVDGLNYAVAEDAPISANAWGNFEAFDQAMYDAIDAARLADHLFIAAAGNLGTDNDGPQPAYPASFDLDNIISVAAVDENDVLSTNFGLTSVDLATSGPSTSRGSARTVGVAALIHSQHPEWTYSQIKDRILSTVDPLPSLAGKTVTGGRLNAAAALAVSSIHVTDPVLVEGNSGTTQLVFTVSRRGDTSQPLTLDWATEDGTATASSGDYIADSGQVSFGAGVTEQTISILVNGDTDEEADETLFLNLSIASGATTIADAKSQAVIQNDDIAPPFNVTGVNPNSAAQGQQLTVTVNGSGFVNGATVDFGDRVTVQSVTFVSASQLDVQIKIHPKAATGSRDVTVTNPDSSSTTLTDGFTVTASLLAETTGDGVDISPLSQADADAFVAYALQLWSQAVGISSATPLSVTVADLPGNVLGTSDGRTITLDTDAAGIGWFIDATPFDDAEFHLGDPDALTHYDLLTAAAHEVGHALGYDHSHDHHDDVMAETLAVGERRLPGHDEDDVSSTPADAMADVAPIVLVDTDESETSEIVIDSDVVPVSRPVDPELDDLLPNSFEVDPDALTFDPSTLWNENEDFHPDALFAEFEQSLADELLAV